jgi:activator of HSP90 ATPase
LRSLIKQSVVLPASAESLYSTYVDPKLHSAMTGAPAETGSESGARFSAFGGQLTGSIITVIAPRLIVQSWRSAGFKVSDPDSTLILTFVPEGDQGRIDLIHIDVPEQEYEGVGKGWDKYYWTPWKNYLARK